MSETKMVQALVRNNMFKRIESQPEIKEHNLSVSKVVGILLKEALDAREAQKNPKKEKIK
jgi:hypothetical protein